MSDDLASYTRRALSEMRALIDRRPGGRASAREERVAVQAWDVRCGRVLSQVIGAGFRYGPAAAHWRSGALVVGANWSARRRPTRGIEGKLGSEPGSWPVPAAACSPLVGIVLRLCYDLRGPEWGDVGKSIGRALARPGLREYAADAHPKRYRAWDWDNLPLVLPAPLCVVLYRSHVVLLADCDRLPVTRGGERLRGLWVIGADGSFADDKGERGWATRRYSCQPLTVEPVAERAKRQRNRPDKTRRFALVGLAAPDPLPAQAPRLLVEAA